MARENFLPLHFFPAVLNVGETENIEESLQPNLEGITVAAFINQIEQISHGKSESLILEHNYLEYCQEQFGLGGNLEQVKSTVDAGLNVADELIEAFTNQGNGYLRDFRPLIDQLSEIKAWGVGKLWETILDLNQPKRFRFEALRKIQLLEGYLAYHQASEKVKDHASYFMNSLSGFWQIDSQVGKYHYFSVEHDPSDYRVKNIMEVRYGEQVRIGPYDKIYPIFMRGVNVDGVSKAVMYDFREKAGWAAVLKQIRKDALITTHPDDVGVRFIVEKEAEIMSFCEHLMSHLRSDGHSVALHSMKSTIDGSKFHGEDKASSTKLRVVQFGLNLDGRHYEIMVHDIEGYVNQTYQDDVGHDEYSLNRLFENEVIELLFPKEIYGTNHLSAHARLIKAMRDQKLWSIDPLVESVTGMTIERYTQSDYASDLQQLIALIDKDEATFKFVVPVDNSALLFASTMADQFGLQIKFITKNTSRRITNSEQYLIVQNVARTGKSAKSLRKRLPNAKTACLINSSEGAVQFDFQAREEVHNHKWFLPFFEPFAYALAELQCDVL